MTSPFAAAAAAMDEDLDGHMGETIQIVPVLMSDYGSAPDPARATFDVVALLSEQDPLVADAGRMMVRVPYEEWTAEFRRALLPVGMVVRKNDEVLAIDRPGAPRFKIVRLEDVDRERIALILAHIAGE